MVKNNEKNGETVLAVLNYFTTCQSIVLGMAILII